MGGGLLPLPGHLLEAPEADADEDAFRLGAEGIAVVEGGRGEDLAAFHAVHLPGKAQGAVQGRRAAVVGLPRSDGHIS